MSVEILYYATIALLTMGILAALVGQRQEKMVHGIAHGTALLGGVTAVLCAISVFSGGPWLAEWALPAPLGSVGVRLDSLAAFFLAIIGGIGALCSCYAWGYAREYYGRRLPLLAGAYNAFLLSMILVVTARQVLGFLAAWEIMAIVSFLLVNHEYERPAVRRAAYIYLVMTHIGTAGIIIAFFLLASHTGSLDFLSFAGQDYPDWLRNAVFLGSALGFGTKAGLMPLHIWLPRAHPAAPSHVSALMSAVMLKTAVYGACRFWLEFLGTGPLWWGLLVVAAAVISAVLGVLYALLEHDNKRQLAYSSVENMGLIWLGMGLGLVFMTCEQPLLAGLAWVAALLHTLNHALFKTLAFMGAGAVLQAVHSRDLEQFGGLIKRMPYTAACCLLGAMALAALPPGNGFVSEWLLLQSIVSLGQAGLGLSGKLLAALLVALVGMAGALAAAVFVEAFGITFLAKPRSEKAATAQEASLFMVAPMALLAAACIITGLWPQPLLTVIGQTLVNVEWIDVQFLHTSSWLLITLDGVRNGTLVSLPGLLLLLAAGLGCGVTLAYMYGRRRTVLAETWTCGIVPDARMEYTATGFSQALRTVFRAIVHPQEERVVNLTKQRYYGRRLRYQVTVSYLFVTLFYRPLNTAILRLSRALKRLQSGSVQLYVGYVLAVTVVVLLWSTRW